MKLGYARVSTARQGESLETQRAALEAAGCDPAHIYPDTISGAQRDHPGLASAIGYARQGDTLVVTRIDGLGRNVRDAVMTIADLAERGINVQVLDPELDTSDPMNKAVVHVMLAFAEWERDLLISRTREGVAHARAKGRVGGQRPKLTAEQVRLAQAAIASGQSVSAVARSLGVSRATMYRALERTA